MGLIARSIHCLREQIVRRLLISRTKPSKKPARKREIKDVSQFFNDR